MAAPKKPKQKTKQRIVSTAKRQQFIVVPKIVIIAAISLTLCFVGWLGLRTYSDWQTHRQFDAATDELTRLKDQIVAKTGEPISIEQKQSCGRQSAKYEEGAQICSSGYTLKRNFFELVSNKAYEDTVVDLVKERYELLLVSESEYPKNQQGVIRLLRNYNLGIMKNIKCSLSFLIYQNSELGIIENNLHLSCGKDSRKTIY